MSEEQDFYKVAEGYQPQARLFIDHAEARGINLKVRDDWWPWWELFLLALNWEDEMADRFEDFDELDMDDSEESV